MWVPVLCFLCGCGCWYSVLRGAGRKRKYTSWNHEEWLWPPLNYQWQHWITQYLVLNWGCIFSQQLDNSLLFLNHKVCLNGDSTRPLYRQCKWIRSTYPRGEPLLCVAVEAADSCLVVDGAAGISQIRRCQLKWRRSVTDAHSYLSMD